MRGDELLEKMELIDPVYIEEADQNPVKRKQVWIKWTAIAACFCLICGLAWLWKDELPKLHILRQDEINTVDTTQAAIDWTELATEPYQLPSNNGLVNGDQSILDGKPIISGFGERSVMCDMSVDNGAVWYSPSLEDALDYYGDTATYRILLEFFSDGVQIPSGGTEAVAEAQRLRNLGYIVAIETVQETVTEGGIATVYATYYFTLHMPYDQLVEFQPDEALGYKFMLYDEVLGKTQNTETANYNRFCS